ncbi:MAG TPA: hypothetical protein VHH73_07335 [Verrucomicrobiae bacterium]|nr:hypothetical protein [Verrucomicrobiae bacterium]
MAPDPLLSRYRNWYAKLVRLYPKAFRERFGEEMELAFHDLCRERVKVKKGLACFALFIFAETLTAIIKENTTQMKRDRTLLLKLVKYTALAFCALMVAGIGTLMCLARGKGEDIAGIVAMALLVTIASGVVATVAAVLKKRARRS